jgi:hypothetical protein
MGRGEGRKGGRGGREEGRKGRKGGRAGRVEPALRDLEGRYHP